MHISWVNGFVSGKVGISHISTVQIFGFDLSDDLGKKLARVPFIGTYPNVSCSCWIGGAQLAKSVFDSSFRALWFMDVYGIYIANEVYTHITGTSL